jgi:hypothetical protein
MEPISTAWCERCGALRPVTIFNGEEFEEASPDDGIVVLCVACGAVIARLDAPGGMFGQ